MQALILAAGLGSRLETLFRPKPLTPVLGMCLLELGVRQAVSAGADEVIVVTGHMAEEVEAAIGSIAHKTGVSVISRRVADWTQPNGHSVLAGAAEMTGPFLLTMADHIFSHSILKRLVGQHAQDRGVTLAVDYRTEHPLIDPDDATWVDLDNRRFIRAIGKNIERFAAVDCGAFLATEELVDAITSAIAGGLPGSLSDGIQRLADGGRAATMDIGDAWWIDVDDGRAHALAERQVAAQLPEIFTQAVNLPLPDDILDMAHGRPEQVILHEQLKVDMRP